MALDLRLAAVQVIGATSCCYGWSDLTYVPRAAQAEFASAVRGAFWSVQVAQARHSEVLSGVHSCVHSCEKVGTRFGRGIHGRRFGVDGVSG